MGDAPASYTAVRRLRHLSAADLRSPSCTCIAASSAPARELLDWCLKEHPGFFGTVLPVRVGAAAQRNRAGRGRRRARGARRRADADRPIHARNRRCTRPARRPAAERQFRLVLERQPHSAQARIALGEALLSQRRYGEAADEAARLPADDPLAVDRCRTELFGRIAAGDFDGARETLGRGRTGWSAGRGAGAVRGLERSSSPETTSECTCPIAAVPLLGVILEALLRVQDFKAFETLLPLLERSGTSGSRAARAARLDLPAARLPRLGRRGVDGGRASSSPMRARSSGSRRSPPAHGLARGCGDFRRRGAGARSRQPRRRASCWLATGRRPPHDRGTTASAVQ